ncbi:MAG: glycosyltransferase family 2 protein [Pseudomonadota bacterium]
MDGEPIDNDMNDRGGHSVAVTAIVVSYFTGPLLTRSLAALATAPEIGEIIVVDNGNGPGAVARAVSENEGGAPIRVITGHGNIGFAAACNLGARAAGAAAFFLFINPDAIMPTGGVKQLIADGEALARPWMQGAKIIDVDGAEQQGSRRATLTPLRAFIEATKLYKLAPRHPYFRRFNLHQEDCSGEVRAAPTISGACFFLPCEDYDAIGGMDERYFLHVEDIDFCLRFAKAGGRVYFNPRVPVVHYKSSSRVSPLRVEARKTASMIRYFGTHFSEPYPAPFLWLVYGALWLAFGLMATKRIAAFGVALIGVGARRGSAGLRRVRAMAARRSSR